MSTTLVLIIKRHCITIERSARVTLRYIQKAYGNETIDYKLFRVIWKIMRDLVDLQVSSRNCGLCIENLLPWNRHPSKSSIAPFWCFNGKGRLAKAFFSSEFLAKNIQVLLLHPIRYVSYMRPSISPSRGKVHLKVTVLIPLSIFRANSRKTS